MVQLTSLLLVSLGISGQVESFRPYVHRNGHLNLQNGRAESTHIWSSAARSRIWATNKVRLVTQISLQMSTSPTTEKNSNNFQLEQSIWMFQNKFPISYEVATNSKNTSDEKNVVPILLLNGFGVGSFHQHRLMKQILLQHQNSQDSTTEYKIYAIDYLGQGKSWPINCNDGMSEDENNLGYSADMWIDQLTGFIQQIIIPSNGKVHIVGNSVGGYLGTILSYRNPELVASLTLLNATPVWGLNLPFWDGKLPAPALPKLVGRTLFDTIRNIDIIDQYLDVAYVHKAAYDGSYIDSFDGWGSKNSRSQSIENENTPLNLKIRGCTEGNGGHAAFASILWSPPASSNGQDASSPVGFYDALQQLPIDVLLLFGSNDEWCTPAVAKRMHTTLHSRSRSVAGNVGAPFQRYVTIDNAAHCPNHEAPTAVAKVLHSWLSSTPSSRSEVPLVVDDERLVKEPWGEVVLREVTIEESESLGLLDKLVSSMVG